MYVPSFLLAAVTVWFLERGVATLAAAGTTGRVLLSGENELAGPIVLAFVLGAVACERRFPAVRRAPAARGQLHDAVYFCFFVAAVVPFTTLLGVGVTSVVSSVTPWAVLGATARMPGWLAITVALILMDGCNWLAHWADHAWAPLWRVHAIHHTQEELSVLTTFRVHPLSHTASTFAATLPVVVLTGYHPMTPVLITGYLVLGALPHANVRWSFGPLGKILCSPAYHRLHHRLQDQGVNLGIVLSIWDVMSKKAVFSDPGTLPCPTGLAGRPIPIEQEGAYRPLHLLVVQLLEPFSPAQRGAQAPVVRQPDDPRGRRSRHRPARRPVLPGRAAGRACRRGRPRRTPRAPTLRGGPRGRSWRHDAVRGRRREPGRSRRARAPCPGRCAWEARRPGEAARRGGGRPGEWRAGRAG